MGVCNCSLICCTLLYVHSSIAIILMGRRELVALLNLSSWCLVMVEWLVLALPWGCLRFVIVIFPDHTHLLFCKRRGHASDQATVSNGLPWTPCNFNVIQAGLVLEIIKFWHLVVPLNNFAFIKYLCARYV